MSSVFSKPKNQNRTVKRETAFGQKPLDQDVAWPGLTRLGTDRLRTQRKAGFDFGIIGELKLSIKPTPGASDVQRIAGVVATGASTRGLHPLETPEHAPPRGGHASMNGVKIEKKKKATRQSESAL